MEHTFTLAELKVNTVGPSLHLRNAIAALLRNHGATVQWKHPHVHYRRNSDWLVFTATVDLAPSKTHPFGLSGFEAKEAEWDAVCNIWEAFKASEPFQYFIEQGCKFDFNIR